MTMHCNPRRTAVAVACCAVALSFLLLSPIAPIRAQHIYKHTRNPPAAEQNSQPVVMLSDLHFEPFQDPARLPQLRESPIEAWPAILSEPASPMQSAEFEALQKACPVRGIDTSWPLFSRSLAQAAAQQPRPLFVTVSGDLLAHAFDCRFNKLVPNATGDDLSVFAAKTVAFVTAQLRASFPASPVFLALGNNDSGCTDYREDRDSPFLRQVAGSFAAAAGSGDNGQAILRSFSDQGDYNIALPAPMHNAHLIVLQDIFEARTFAACNGKPIPDAATVQLTWLQTQLADARTHHQHVWVMAHVPPGLDMYSTLKNQVRVCSGAAPIMFLGSEAIAEVLEAYPDVISLAVFAHSHEDELRFLHAPGSTNGIAAKLVSSISPVNGNHPTFTVAQVDPRNATLLDYTVYLTGEGSAATREYSFRETYKLPAFSAAALQSLTAGFLADAASTDPQSQAYRHFFFPGDNGVHAIGMQVFWRAYVCSLREDNPDAYRACACSARTAVASQ